MIKKLFRTIRNVIWGEPSERCRVYETTAEVKYNLWQFSERADQSE